VKATLSLRARVMLGAVLWTFGLLAGAVLLSTFLLLRYPRYPLILHGTALHYAVALAFGVVICMIIGLSQIRIALSPLNRLRGRLSDVHAGRDRRVQGEYPAEVQPLVDDLNALLEDRERRVAQALAKAGDLAHGLKTPLAVLSQEAERMAAAGHADLAAVLGGQVERMRRQVDHHLVHARAAASGATPGVRGSVRESADGLSRTLARLHADRGLTIAVDVSSDTTVRIRREDLDEMLGNLLDNACQWARSRVSIASSPDGGRVQVAVDDDGPGLNPALWEKVLQRGVRADEAAPGSGFGLAIVRELAELHGGSIVLSRSPAGGLRACLDLPAG